MNVPDRIVVYITCLMLMVYGLMQVVSLVDIAESISSRDSAFSECSKFLMPNGDNIWFDARVIDNEVYCTSIYNGSSYSISVSELKSSLESNAEQEAHQ